VARPEIYFRLDYPNCKAKIPDFEPCLICLQSLNQGLTEGLGDTATVVEIGEVVLATAVVEIGTDVVAVILVADVMATVEVMGIDVRATVEVMGADVRATVEVTGADVRATVEVTGADVRATVEVMGIDVVVEPGVPLGTRLGSGERSIVGKGVGVGTGIGSFSSQPLACSIKPGATAQTRRSFSSLT